MFKNSIDFVFFVIVVVGGDDGENLEFINKFDVLQIKTKIKQVKTKIL